MMKTKLLRAQTLDLKPCCIAFNALHPQIFIVGTYELKEGDSEESSTKEGSLILFHLEHNVLYVLC